MTTDGGTETVVAPNWRHVGAFLGLTFGLTWLLDLAIYLRGGLAQPGMITTLQLQMLLPAFCATVLGLWAFPESPIYHKRPGVRGRWFFYYYLLLTVIFGAGVLALWLAPTPTTVLQTLAAVTQALALVGLIVLIVLRLATGREAAEQVWLLWGKFRYWLLFGIAFIVYYALQALLNAVTGLGGATLSPTTPTPAGLSPNAFLVLGGAQTVLLAPVLAIVIAFGEEYGWRGYLQTELFKLGRVRGVLILGTIWGIWHWPVILMGYNYPGYPLLGLPLFVLYTIGLAIVLGYAVLKSRSVLLSSYLHALNNQVLAFIIFLGFAPHDPVLSFDIGIYGIITLAIVALPLLRDPIWRGKGSSLA